MSNLHKEILKNRSPFRHMVVAAWLVGVANVVAIAADLYWLVGDMSIVVHSHHYGVLLGLVLGLSLTVVSFVWLYMGVNKYLDRHDHIHTKHERLTAEIEILKDRLALLDFKINVQRADQLAGLDTEDK